MASRQTCFLAVISVLIGQPHLIHSVCHSKSFGFRVHFLCKIIFFFFCDFISYIEPLTRLFLLSFNVIHKKLICLCVQNLVSVNYYVTNCLNTMNSGIIIRLNSFINSVWYYPYTVGYICFPLETIETIICWQQLWRATLQKIANFRFDSNIVFTFIPFCLDYTEVGTNF